MHSATLHPHKSTSTANRHRLYWAMIRIMIALASTCFFLYFLSVVVQAAIDIRTVYQTVTVEVAIIDWIRINGEEVEVAQYLVRNVTSLPPDIYADNPLQPILLSFSDLLLIQRNSFELLRSLAEGTRAAGMLLGNESEQMDTYMVRVESVHHRLELASASAASSSDATTAMFVNFTWSWYFDMIDFWHALRFFLINVVSRNIDYRRQELATYGVALTALLYYRENLSSMRDAVLRYAYDPTNTNQDTVVEYRKARSIYEREVAQKNPPDLVVFYAAAEDLPQYRLCDAYVESIMERLHEVDYFINNSGASSFNASAFYDCVVLMLHSHNRLRYELRGQLLSSLDRYVKEIVASLVVACVGIVLELLAAGTLVQQSLPVVILYIKLQTVVKKSTQLSNSAKAGGAGGSGDGGGSTPNSSSKD